MTDLTGIYVGIVESNTDPEQLGRLQVRVPAVYGPDAAGQSIAAQDLPWAWAMGMPNGTNSQAGGMTWLPNAGDQVVVMFLDGEPEKPVWSWGPRTAQASVDYTFTNESGKKRPLVDYDDKGRLMTRKLLSVYDQNIIFTPVMLHLRSASGSFLELQSNDDYAMLSTALGYSFSAANATSAGTLDGTVTMRTASGSYFTLDDSITTALLYTTTLSVLATDVMFNTVDFDMMCTGACNAEFVGDTRWICANYRLGSAGEVKLHGTKALTLSSTSISTVGVTHLGKTTATDPVVRFSDLNQLCTWLLTHTHGNGNMGSPTTAPTQPLVTPSGSSQVFCV